MGQRDGQVWTATVKPDEATSEAELIDALHAQLGQGCSVSAQDLRRAMAGCLDDAEDWTALHVAIAEVDDD